MTSAVEHVPRTPIRGAFRGLAIRHVLGFGVNFVGAVILARSLGPSIWGLFGIALTAQLVAQAVLERGAVGQIVQRASAPSSRDLSSALVVQMVGGGLAAAALVAVAQGSSDWIHDSRLALLLYATAASLFGYALRALPLGLLERGLRYNSVAVVELTDIVTFNAVAVIGLSLGFGVPALAAALTSRVILSCLVALAFAGPRFARPSLGSIRAMLTFAVPFAASNGLTWVNNAAAPVLLGTFAALRDFGLIQMAYSIMVYPQVVTAIVARIAFPVYARISKDTRQLTSMVNEWTSVLLKWVGGATLVVAATSPAWVPVVYGSEWAELAPLMMIIAIPFALGNALLLTVAALNVRGMASRTMFVSLAFTFLYWSLAVVAVPTSRAFALPLAYAVATLSASAYIRLYRRRIGPLSLPGLREFAFLSCGVLLAAGWYTLLGDRIGPAAIGIAMAVWILRSPAELREIVGKSLSDDGNT